MNRSSRKRHVFFGGNDLELSGCAHGFSNVAGIFGSPYDRDYRVLVRCIYWGPPFPKMLEVRICFLSAYRDDIRRVILGLIFSRSCT